MMMAKVDHRGQSRSSGSGLEAESEEQRKGAAGHRESGVVEILVINLHSSRNAGDAALTKMAIQQLRAAFPEARITLAMNDPSSHTGPERVVGSFLHWSKRLDSDRRSRWRWTAIPDLVLNSLVPLIGLRWLGAPLWLTESLERRGLIKAYFDADLVVSCPGNFLLSSGRIGIPFLIAVYQMAFAYLAGKPFYTFPQTIGPLHRWWERLLVRWVVSKARLVELREPLSLELLRRTQVPVDRCLVLPDIAFGLEGRSAEDALRFLKESGIDIETDRPLLGITLLNWGAQNIRFKRQQDYEDAVVQAIGKFLKRHGGKAILFSQVCGPSVAEDDRVPARRVAARLRKLGEKVVVIDSIVEPSLLKACYGMMDLFIGTRMHSNIFALSSGVPVLAIGYLFKTRGIMKSVGLQQWVIDIDQINGANLSNRLELAWKQRAETRKQIACTMPEIIERADRAAQYIAHDFFAEAEEDDATHPGR